VKPEAFEHGGPRAWRPELEEVGQPLGFGIVQGDSRLRTSTARAVGPDAEADVPLLLLRAEIAGDAKRPTAVAGDPGMRPEELHELQPLRLGAPGAKAKRLLDRAPATRTVVHSGLLCEELY